MAISNDIALFRYSPDNIDKDSLKKLSVSDSRQKLFKNTLEEIKSAAANKTPRYYLVIGPRGIGKSHFLTLLYYEIQEKMDSLLIPVKFAEEEYSIFTVIDLFKRILEEIPQEYKIILPSDYLKKSDDELFDFLLSTLREIAKTSNKQFIVFIENLNDILKQMDINEIRKFRSVLHQEEIFFIIGSSPIIFPGITEYQEPFYNFFQTIHLKELKNSEIKEMMINIAILEKNEKFLNKISHFDSKIKGISPLIGGSPRLVLLFYELIAREDFDNIEKTVFKIIDEHTPYYQEIIQQFSGQKKKIFDTLLTAPTPLTPTDIAQKTRIDINVVNTQLRRLEKERHVISRSIKKRTSYYVREQLFRFWREMRQPFGKHRVSLFIEFLKLYYTTQERRERFKSKFDLLVAGDKTVIKDVCYYIETLPVKCKFEFLPQITEKINELGSYENVAQHIQKIKYDLTEYENKFIGGAADQFEKKMYDDALISLNKCLNFDPLNGEALKLKARTLEKLGKPDEAIDILDNLIKRNSNDADILKLKGRILLRINKFDEALSLFNKTLELVPGDEEALYYKVGSLGELNKLEEANKIINKSLAIDPEKVTTLISQGFILTKSGKNEDAYNVFTKILKISPENIFLKKFIAHTFADLGKNSEAITVCDSILAQNPTDTETQLLKSHLLEIIGKIEDSFEIIDQILERDPDNEEALQIKGRGLGDLGQFKKAIDIFNKKLELNPNDEVALAYKGCALGETSQFEEALDIFNKMLDINPNNEEALIWKGRALTELGKNEDALNILNKVLTSNPSNEDALFFKGLALAEIGKLEDSLDIFNKALEYNPNNFNAINEKILVLRRINKNEEALKFVNERLENCPDDESKLLFYKAGLLYDLSKNVEAIKIINDLIKTVPSDSIYRLKAGILSQLEDNDEAINSINMAIQMNPNSDTCKLDKAKILFNSKKYDEDIQYINEIFDKIKLKDVTIVLKLILIDSYIQINKNVEALFEIEQFTDYVPKAQPKELEHYYELILELALAELNSGNQNTGIKLINRVFFSSNLDDTKLKTYAIDFINNAIDTGNVLVINAIIEELIKIKGQDFTILLKPFLDALNIIKGKKTSYYNSNLQVEEREIVSEIVKRITQSDELQFPK